MPTHSFLKEQRRSLLVFYCIPVGPGRSRLISVFPRNFSVWIDRIVPRWIFHVRYNLVLDSDLHLLHIEVKWLAFSILQFLAWHFQYRTQFKLALPYFAKSIIHQDMDFFFLIWYRFQLDRRIAELVFEILMIK